MASTASPDETAKVESAGAESSGHNQRAITDYLLSASGEFRALYSLRQRGWKARGGDHHFARQRNTADNADSRTRRIFFGMQQEIALEMQSSTTSLSLSPPSGHEPAILDLCMAPGGFTSSALAINPTASIKGISLPISQGGHEMLIPNWHTDPRISVQFLDITLLSSPMGITSPLSIPPTHPDAAELSLHRPIPFGNQTFDLVFCDGQVLRNHPRHPYRDAVEARRLAVSQLVLAFHLLRPEGTGTLVVLLHKVEKLPVVQLLRTLSLCSASVELFKPEKKHSIRSSFYVVAKGVRPDSPDAVSAVQSWQRQWKAATLGTEEELAAECHVELGEVETLLIEFGDELVRLGNPIWKIQAEALRRAPFMKGHGGKGGQGFGQDIE